MDRIKKVPKVLYSNDSVESDAFLNFTLKNKTKPLIEYDITNIVNQQEQFEKERREVRKYRFSGKINTITANELTQTTISPNGDGTTTITVGALNEDWDPLFDGDPKVTPNNWLLQILYPYKKDSEFNITTYFGNGTIPNITTSRAEQGPQIERFSLGIQSGEEKKVSVYGLQKNNLKIDDYVYVYDTQLTPNPYTGIHKIISLGLNGENIDKNFIIDTPYNIDYNQPSNYRRIVNVTDNDLNFSKPIDVNKITACDANGNTLGPFLPNDIIYSKLELQDDIGFVPFSGTSNPYIDLRGVGVLNGLFEVVNFINPFVIIIKLDYFSPVTTKGQSLVFTAPKPQLRILDGTPSEYYVRKYKVLTVNDYDSYRCAFSSSIYPDTIVNTLGVSNDTWLYHFNKDVDVEGLLDHNDKPLTELYLGFIKRAGQNTYPWSNVVAGWDFNKKFLTTVNGLENVYIFKVYGVGTIEKPNTNFDYFGDYSEYNKIEIEEKIVSKIIHRFGKQTDPNGEGYYLEPFKKMRIMGFSNVIEFSSLDEPTEGIPNYAEVYPDKSIAWKDLLFIGYLEPENENTVDYPFVNGRHYFYDNYNFYIRRQDPPSGTTINQDTVKISKIQDVCSYCKK